jgi:hypothetical protein
MLYACTYVCMYVCIAFEERDWILTNILCCMYVRIYVCMYNILKNVTVFYLINYKIMFMYTYVCMHTLYTCM